MYYSYQDFNKSDKRLLRSLVEISVKNEVKSFLLKSYPIHKNIVEKEHEDIREPYWDLFNSFKDFSKHLNRRYDDYRHSELPHLLTRSRVEGNLTDIHFADFSEDGKSKLNEMLVLEKKHRGSS